MKIARIIIDCKGITLGDYQDLAIRSSDYRPIPVIITSIVKPKQFRVTEEVANELIQTINPKYCWVVEK